MDEMRFDRTMSHAEGLMWRLDTDPHLSSTFATVLVLDRAPDFDAFRRRMERAAIMTPRLRQRVLPTLGNVAPPTWVDDPDFDIDLHVRRMACPQPGTLRQVLDLTALFMLDPFDRSRPLWQFVVVEGLAGGQAAVIQKMHHSISDGERGVELSLRYLDFEREAPEPPAIDPESLPPSPAPPPSTLETVRDLIGGSLRVPIGVARQVRELLADPSALPDASSSAARSFRGIVNQLSDVERARSPLWTERSLRRHIEPVRVPFRETKDAARRLDGTLNTAFLTAAAHAAAAYHRAEGAPVESLRATMAVSTRTETSGANAFSLVRLLVPTGEMPIAERFLAIQENARMARDSSDGAGLDTLATVASNLPTPVISRIARRQAQTVDFATSNLKGSPIPCYVAGSEVVGIHPIGPLAGVAFNLTLMSYVGSLEMGLNCDLAAITDPALLARCLTEAFGELAAV